MGKVMLWVTVKEISEVQFQRLSGVKPAVFEKMVSIVSTYKLLKRKHPTKGRPCKLSIEDQVLMLLMYYREYRSLLHIAITYGISEGQCWRIITALEKMLIASKALHLPAKKSLTQNPTTFEAVLIDVGESPIERPKKSKGAIIPAKRSAIA